MKVKVLRELIKRLQFKVKPVFESAINEEFPKLLASLDDEDDLPLIVLQNQSDSLKLLNAYGVLFSIASDEGVKNDKKLLHDLLDVNKQIGKEFPDLDTSYCDDENLSYFHKVLHSK